MSERDEDAILEANVEQARATKQIGKRIDRIYDELFLNLIEHEPRRPALQQASLLTIFSSKEKITAIDDKMVTEFDLGRETARGHFNPERKVLSTTGTSADHQVKVFGAFPGGTLVTAKNRILEFTLSYRDGEQVRVVGGYYKDALVDAKGGVYLASDTHEVFRLGPDGTVITSAVIR